MTRTLSAADITGAAPASQSAAAPAAVPSGYASYRVQPRRQSWRLERIKSRAGEVSYAVSDSALGVFGVGPDVNEAVRDLLRARRDHREVLESQPELSAALKVQLKSLQRRK
jgi:hypothetical protein